MPSPYPAELAPAAACTFCRLIADGADLVYAGATVAAFLDHKPLFPGHLLITPVAHVLTLDQLDHDGLVDLFAVVQLAVAAMPTALGAQGAFVANNNIVSQSVPHLHVHVVPRTKGDGLRGFFWPRTTYTSPAHKAEVHATLAATLA